MTDRELLEMEYDDICRVCGTYCPEGGGIHPGCGEAVDAAVAVEREACATLCESMPTSEYFDWAGRTRRKRPSKADYAAAIRARGTVES